MKIKKNAIYLAYLLAAEVALAVTPADSWDKTKVYYVGSETDVAPNWNSSAYFYKYNTVSSAWEQLKFNGSDMFQLDDVIATASSVAIANGTARIFESVTFKSFTVEGNALYRLRCDKTGYMRTFKTVGDFIKTGNSEFRIASQYYSNSNFYVEIGGNLKLGDGTTNTEDVNVLFGTGTYATDSTQWNAPLKSLSVGKNMQVNGKLGAQYILRTNIYSGTGSANIPDISISGVVSGENSSWYINNNNSTTSLNINVGVGGLEGGIYLTNHASTANGSSSNIVLNNASGSSFSHNGNIRDDAIGADGEDGFNSLSTLSLQMKGEGTQYLRGGLLKFSGGVICDSGKLYVNGKAFGSDQRTHGSLEMNGGTFGIYNNSNGEGTFTFTDLYWNAGKISLGVYDNTVDMLTFSGQLEKGSSSSIDDVWFEFDGGCNALTVEKQIVAWSGYDSDFFSAESFKASNMTDLYTGKEMKAQFRLDSNGVYVTYVAVPESASFAFFVGIFAIVSVLIRTRKVR